MLIDKVNFDILNILINFDAYFDFFSSSLKMAYFAVNIIEKFSISELEITIYCISTLSKILNKFKTKKHVGTYLP